MLVENEAVLQEAADSIEKSVDHLVATDLNPHNLFDNRNMFQYFVPKEG